MPDQFSGNSTYDRTWRERRRDNRICSHNASIPKVNGPYYLGPRPQIHPVTNHRDATLVPESRNTNRNLLTEIAVFTHDGIRVENDSAKMPDVEASADSGRGGYIDARKALNNLRDRAVNYICDEAHKPRQLPEPSSESEDCYSPDALIAEHDRELS